MAQITSVTSEQLQNKIRELLPSQQGFGEDLQASNVILPVIDLTATAEGSTTPQYMQTAIAFGSQTAFDIINTTTVIVNTAGFYRIFGVSNLYSLQAAAANNSFTMSDGLSTKQIWDHFTQNTTTNDFQGIQFDFTVFLRSGDSISGVTNNAFSSLAGSVRQVADVNGNLVNPAGFTPQ